MAKGTATTKEPDAYAIGASGGLTGGAGSGSTWLDARHPDYRASVDRWTFARAHYRGDVLDRACIDAYLIRRAIAESENSYLERSQLADYTPHFATAVDALAGMLFAVEGDANRFLGDDERDGIGAHDDEDSPMHRLWTDIDGQGTGWLTFFKQLAIELIVSHRAWIIVSKDAQDQAVVQLWPATQVINWWYDASGRLAEIVVRDVTDARTGVKDTTGRDAKQRWRVYTLAGWEVWEKDAKGQPTQVVAESGTYAKPFVDANEQSILPAFCVELPIQRPIGWLLAKKANAIFNKESERDHILRVANFPLLVLVGNDNQFKKHVADIAKGVRALQQDPGHASTHGFIAPSPESATVATEVLKRKVEEFYITFFREYGDAAREKTATETRQDVASGVGAFLQMLKAAVDDAENGVLLRVAQIELPNEPDRWFVNRVERSESFVPTDVQGIITGLKARYFQADQPVPLGPTGRFNIAKQIAQYDGVPIDETELKASIATDELQRLFELFDKMPVPAVVRVDMALELLTDLGYVDPEEKLPMDDGSEKLKIDQLRAEMLDLATADDEAKKRMAQPLDLGPPGTPPPPNRVPPQSAPRASGGPPPSP